MILTKLVRFGGAVPRRSQLGIQLRALSSQPRTTLSSIWMPPGGKTPYKDESANGMLLRAGFLLQAQSGIFQLLPLGLRVQDKIEKLIDKHMQSIGASKLSLSTISSEKLWRKSGRLDLISSELFRLEDRKGVAMILAPTHEEEITSLVARSLNSYKDVPIRLYQITRKYRDERRPRHGLLRSREFLMKDLYTFDLTVDDALATYKQVSAAYQAFFSELKLPFIVAEASSGDMGGDQSHEYHLPSEAGEDTVFKCDACGYSANDEVAIARTPVNVRPISDPERVAVWRGISKDRKTLVNAWHTRIHKDGVSLHAIKEAFPDIDTAIDKPGPFWDEALDKGVTDVVNLVDARLVDAFDDLMPHLPLMPPSTAASSHKVQHSFILNHLNLRRVANEDGCPKCPEGTLHAHRALEVGHTFHLGTRYSAPLDASVQVPSGGGSGPQHKVHVQMGCHGIGVSRIFGAAAEVLVDEEGLNWPRSIAPFEVVVVSNPTQPDAVANAEKIYDALVAGEAAGRPVLDVVLDDRTNTKMSEKVQAATLIGYPVVIIVSKLAVLEGTVEVRCRRLSVKEDVAIDNVRTFVADLLDRL